MKKVKIEETNNGYLVHLHNQQYVFKSTEVLAMLEYIGKFVNERKVEVKEK